jgi:hypothetical protein
VPTQCRWQAIASERQTVASSSERPASGLRASCSKNGVRFWSAQAECKPRPFPRAAAIYLIDSRGLRHIRRPRFVGPAPACIFELETGDGYDTSAIWCHASARTGVPRRQKCLRERAASRPRDPSRREATYLTCITTWIFDFSGVRAPWEHEARRNRLGRPACERRRRTAFGERARPAPPTPNGIPIKESPSAATYCLHSRPFGDGSARADIHRQHWPAKLVTWASSAPKRSILSPGEGHESSNYLFSASGLLKKSSS